MSNPYKPIDELDIINTPSEVEKYFRWLHLLDLKVALFRDQRDGSFVFLLLRENSPDLFIEMDPNTKMILIYSNILTELKDIPEDKSYEFLIEALMIQSQYPRVRVNVIDKEMLPIKLFSRHRTNLTFENLAELIRENCAFLEELQEMLVNHQLPENWRISEGEPHSSTDGNAEGKKFEYDYF